jgi:hypothetical protein
VNSNDENDVGNGVDDGEGDDALDCFGDDDNDSDGTGKGIVMKMLMLVIMLMVVMATIVM